MWGVQEDMMFSISISKGAAVQGTYLVGEEHKYSRYGTAALPAAYTAAASRAALPRAQSSPVMPLTKMWEDICLGGSVYPRNILSVVLGSAPHPYMVS